MLKEILDHLKNSVLLMVLSTLVIHFVAIPMGIYSGVRSGSVPDRVLIGFFDEVRSQLNKMGHTAVFILSFRQLDSLD